MSLTKGLGNYRLLSIVDGKLKALASRWAISKDGVPTVYVGTLKDTPYVGVDHSCGVVLPIWDDNLLLTRANPDIMKAIREKMAFRIIEAPSLSGIRQTTVPLKTIEEIKKAV